MNKRQRKLRRKAKRQRRAQYVANMQSKAEQRKHRTAADIIADMDALTHRTTVNVDGHHKRSEYVGTDLMGNEVYRTINPTGIRTEQ